jgi:predicted dehydrogenase
MPPIRVGLIGCGGFMRNMHLPHLMESDAFSVHATCDVHLPAAEALCATAQAQYATDDPARLLDDPEIDAVIIATRHNSHAALSVAAAQAGKHILCEKPMGLNARECREVAEAIRGAGVHYTVGYNRGIAPLVVRAREILAGRPEKRLIYHRIQAPFPPSHWTHLPEVGGGRFVGEGCHIFDLLCELVPAPPVSVYASGGTFLPPDLVHIPDSGIVTLTFADGSVGTTLIASDGCARFPKESTEVYCAARAILIEDFRSLTYRDVDAAGDETIALPTQDKGHARELALFGEAILGGSPAPNGLTQAMRAALISFKVLESIASGAPVPIEPSEYTIEERVP